MPDLPRERVSSARPEVTSRGTVSPGAPRPLDIIQIAGRSTVLHRKGRLIHGPSRTWKRFPVADMGSTRTSEINPLLPGVPQNSRHGDSPWTRGRRRGNPNSRSNNNKSRQKKEDSAHHLRFGDKSDWLRWLDGDEDEAKEEGGEGAEPKCFQTAWPFSDPYRPSPPETDSGTRIGSCLISEKRTNQRKPTPILSNPH